MEILNKMENEKLDKLISESLRKILKENKSNQDLLNFMNSNKKELIKKLDWHLKDDNNNDLPNFVDSKNLKFELNKNFPEQGVNISEPEEWDDLPHYGKTFKWLEDADSKTFQGEEGEPFKILDIKGQKIAYIEYNV